MVTDPQRIVSHFLCTSCDPRDAFSFDHFTRGNQMYPKTHSQSSLEWCTISRGRQLGHPARHGATIRTVIRPEFLYQSRFLNVHDIDVTQKSYTSRVQPDTRRRQPQGFTKQHDKSTQQDGMLQVGIWPSDDQSRWWFEQERGAVPPANQVVGTGKTQGHPCHKQQCSTAGPYRPQGIAQLCIQGTQLQRNVDQEYPQDKRNDQCSHPQSWDHGQWPRNVGLRFSSMAKTPSFASSLLRARVTMSCRSFASIVSRVEMARRIIAFIPASER